MYLYMVCMCVFTGSVSSQVNAIYNSMYIYILSDHRFVHPTTVNPQSPTWPSEGQ